MERYGDVLNMSIRIKSAQYAANRTTFMNINYFVVFSDKLKAISR